MQRKLRLGTLTYQIDVGPRVFILRQKWAKNSQNLAILCTKPENLYTSMHLFDGPRLFDRLEYEEICQAQLICRKWKEIIDNGNLLKKGSGKIFFKMVRINHIMS